MKRTGGGETAKRHAGERAAEAVDDGDVVGLGTGSTAAHAIRALGRRVDAGLDVTGVATSFQSRELAREVGVPVTTLDDVGGVDVAIDGADQFDRETGALIKGGGAAHAREKVVDASADRFLVVADPTKAARGLDASVPVEVLPSARRPVEAALDDLGGEPTLRAAARKDGPVVTDNGNLVLDCAFGALANPDALAVDLSGVPGVVAHGLFVGLADAVLVGTEDGVERYDYAAK
ncbi:ribose 5-phosphate isomerase A [Halarchaeum rubridurum]|uniref:Ribose-5-phosphate isomerase A n=1 Tax=Halarchaeum rubridurum TaxID=489911 RepID=A0A830FTV8_9EURY|nr:ribose-5-phosphate isomerase RpiA [Halarchaeum rubridurum]MBP1954315.1 ribose 5-phosphate isomerase A [Halarchaeum rubridurum]GGM59036.1 ribose-5-phosphate isomerase [Halarchaeum rubridurum]